MCKRLKQISRKGKANKKTVVSYPKMVALLSVLHIDLNWADDQYWCTLLAVIREANIIRTPKKKEKVTASEMQQLIKD